MIFARVPDLDQKGFSFMELMLVVAIIGILASVAAPAYFHHTMRSRQTKVIGELLSIKASEERYYAENGFYTSDFSQLDQYAVAGTMTIEDYKYDVVGVTLSGGNVISGTLRASGDLNGDGAYTNIWQLSIDNLGDKPSETAVGNEGFSWSSLAEIF